MALRELLASFRIDTGQAVGALKNVDAKIDSAAGKLGGFADAVMGTLSFGGMSEFIKSQIDAGSAVNDMAERLGVGTDELQQFQFAAGLAGVDAERAGTSLQFLNKNIGEALSGNAEAAKSFKELGVEIKDKSGTVRELGDVIPEVADAFSKMGSDQERTVVAMKLFGKSGAALIPLLKGGAEGLAEMNKEFVELGGGLSKDFVAAADKTGDELDKLKFGIKGVKASIALALLPYVQKAIAFGQVWIKRIIAMTRETNILKYITVAFGLAGAASAAKMASGFAKMFGLITPGKGGIVAMLRSMGGFGLIIGLVLGLALVLEDLFTAVQDGDSYIVELVEHYLGLDEANGLVAALKEAWVAVQQAIKPLEPLLDSVGAYIGKIATEYGPKVLHVFVEIVKTIAQAITKVAEFFGLMDSEKTGAGVSAEMLRKRTEGLTARTAPVVSSDSLPKVSAGSLGGPTNVTQTNRTEITVQGGPTPQATGQAVKTAQRDVMAEHLADLHAGLEG